MPFQFSKFSVSGMLSGVVSSSIWTRWQSILLIPRRFNFWVRPAGRYFADNVGGKGDLSNSLNTAAPSCWESYQNALTISAVSEMYPTAVICLISVRNSFSVAHQFWRPCHIYKKLWTLASLCNFLSAASLFNSEWFSEFVVSNAGSTPAIVPLLAYANCLITTFSRRVSPVVLDCLKLITSCRGKKQASTPTPSGVTEIMSRATL